MESQEATLPDLSHITEQLRPLAVPCDSVQFDPNNARLHPEKNLEAIRASVRVYGQRRPIVVNQKTGHVEAGNGLLQAMLSLGHKHIAAVFVEESEAAANGYALADNRSAELSLWDKDLLDKALRDMNTGNDPVLDAMMADLAKAEKLFPDDKPEEKAPEAAKPEESPAKEAVCPQCGHAFALPAS